jgi:hypothetical protein
LIVLVLAPLEVSGSVAGGSSLFLGSRLVLEMILAGRRRRHLGNLREGHSASESLIAVATRILSGLLVSSYGVGARVHERGGATFEVDDVALAWSGEVLVSIDCTLAELVVRGGRGRDHLGGLGGELAVLGSSLGVVVSSLETLVGWIGVEMDGLLVVAERIVVPASIHLGILHLKHCLVLLLAQR